MVHSVQLDFRCRSCGLAGLTPEVTQQEAFCLVSGKLEIRCPKCSALLAIQANGADILAGSPAMNMLDAVRKELEGILAQELVDPDDD